MTAAAPTTDREPADAVARTEYLLAIAVAMFRIGGLVELLVVAIADAPNYATNGAVPIGLIVATAVEGIALCVACVRGRRLPSRWVYADLVFVLVVLAIGAACTAPQYHRLFFMYPFSLLGSVAFGVYFRRFSAVLLATVVLAADYLVSAMLWQHMPPAQLGINTTSYFPNTAVAWAVARRLRLTGAELKASRGRVAELARDNERIRHARILHDRVLQTLEALATGGWIADDQVRAHVATEATWLRGLVEDNVRGAPIPGEGQLDLLAALQDLVDRCAREGLRVELNASGLREQARWRHAMPAETASALVEATREVLTNVRKHAGVDSAVLRVSAIGDELTLSVLDNGCGFDSATVRHGMGLDQSIVGRITEIGGTVRIDSAPGAGTYVEISLARLPG